MQGAEILFFIVFFIPYGITYLLWAVHPALGLAWLGILVGAVAGSIGYVAWAHAHAPAPTTAPAPEMATKSADSASLGNAHTLAKAFGLTGIFLSLLSAAIELGVTARTLFGGSRDRRKIINKNWMRTADFVHAAFKVVGLSIAAGLFIGAPGAAPLALTIVLLGSAAYSISRSILAFVNFAKCQDPVLRANYKKEALQHLGTGLSSLAMLALLITIMVVPIAPTVLLGLGIASVVIGVGLLIATAVKAAVVSKKSTQEVSPQTKTEELDTQIIQAAKTKRALPRAKRDYHHTVDHAKVVSQLSSAKTAHEYLQTEIETQRAGLQSTMQRHGERHPENPKRLDKCSMLNRLQDFLTALDTKQFTLNTTESFEQAFERYCETKGPEEVARYQAERKKAFQSFGLAMGNVEAVFRGVAEHVELLQKDGYGVHEPAAQVVSVR